jgi:spermidine synthase
MRRGPGERVVVRQVRQGRALRIDGTFASWYAPGQPLTGSVWDALALPLLALPPERRRSLLVLGLGGGSVARVARAIAPRARIVGVERSREVVRAARRWFDLDPLGVEVVEADARDYLARTRGRFDAVIEDVFVGNERTLRKPDWLPNPGLARAVRRLRPGGLLVCNSVDETPAVTRAVRAHFPSTLHIGVADYDNRVVVGGPAALSARSLRAAVAAHPVLSRTLPRLRFRGAPP